MSRELRSVPLITTGDAEHLDELNRELDRLAGTHGALVPALEAAQDIMGYVSDAAIRLISQRLDIRIGTIFGVTSFYSYFSRTPRGKYIVRVCMGTACYVLGANQVLDEFKKQLKVDVGGTTEDMLFTLEAGRCFGACGLAPVLLVNDDIHDRVKPKDVSKIIAMYRKGEKKDT